MNCTLLAIDGGQTATRGVLADDAGRVLSTAAGGSADRLELELADLVTGLGRSPVEVAAACIGLTSVDDEEGPEVRVLAASLARLMPAARVRVVPDREAALAGAIDDHGVVVVAGGGAIATGIGPRGERVVLSGYGYRIGEDGSALDLGRRAVAAGLRAWEGRGPATELTSVVAAEFALEAPREIVARVYAPDFRRSRLATLAPAVLAAAEAGDVVAAALADTAAEELSAAAAAAVAQLYEPEETAQVALTGGLLGGGTLLTRLVEERVGIRVPGAQVSVVPHASAAGAVVLAGRLAGLPIDRGWVASARASVAARLG